MWVYQRVGDAATPAGASWRRRGMITVSMERPLERTSQYRGDLRQTALPEMLAIIQQARVAGVIEAVLGDVTKRIFLENGYVVHASSSDLADSLGGFLRRVGKLSEADFRSAMAKRAASGQRLGELLIEQGTFSPAQVFQAIREHVEGIVWSLFAWEEGDVTFNIGPFEEGTPSAKVVVRLHRAATLEIVARVDGRAAQLTDMELRWGATADARPFRVRARVAAVLQFDALPIGTGWVSVASGRVGGNLANFAPSAPRRVELRPGETTTLEVDLTTRP